MKIKLLIILSLITLSIFYIYLTNVDNKIYLLSLGNNKIYDYNSYSDIVSKNLDQKLEKNININKSINEIINDIKENKKIQNRNMKNHLVKADLVIITTTTNDDNLEELIKLVKEYCKEDILVVGKLNNINIKITRNNKIELINIEPKISELSNTKDKNIYISDKILHFIDENILN